MLCQVKKCINVLYYYSLTVIGQPHCHYTEQKCNYYLIVVTVTMNIDIALFKSVYMLKGVEGVMV